MKYDHAGIPLPDQKPERRSLAEALRAAALPQRAPTEADAPPLSTFPKTAAAREALRLDKERWAPQHKIVGRGARRERAA